MANGNGNTQRTILNLGQYAALYDRYAAASSNSGKPGICLTVRPMVQADGSVNPVYSFTFRENARTNNGQMVQLESGQPRSVTVYLDAETAETVAHSILTGSFMYENWQARPGQGQPIVPGMATFIRANQQQGITRILTIQAPSGQQQDMYQNWHITGMVSQNGQTISLRANLPTEHIKTLMLRIVYFNQYMLKQQLESEFATLINALRTNRQQYQANSPQQSYGAAVPQMPGAPQMPQTPGIPQMPQTPGIPQAPTAPQMPQQAPNASAPTPGSPIAGGPVASPTTPPTLPNIPGAPAPGGGQAQPVQGPSLGEVLGQAQEQQQ